MIVSRGNIVVNISRSDIIDMLEAVGGENLSDYRVKSILINNDSKDEFVDNFGVITLEAKSSTT